MFGTGKYIAIEGIDGVGKTTNINLLKSWFLQKGVEVFTTREPSDGPIGKAVRNFWQNSMVTSSKSLALLFAADSLYNQEGPEGVLYQLRQKRYVLSDRSFLSTYAYLMPDCDLSWLDELHKYCHFPDITFFIDLPPSIAMERLLASRDSFGMFENLESLSCVREQYLNAIEVMKSRNHQIEIIEAKEDTGTREIQEQMCNGIEYILPLD